MKKKPVKHTHFLHPGEIIKIEFLEEYNMSIKAAAEAMHMPRSRLNDIIRGVRGITADTALRLSRFFGAPPDFWLRLQSFYDIQEAEAQAKSSKTSKMLKSIRPASETWAGA
jgi:addiction module HigA family antidote